MAWQALFSLVLPLLGGQVLALRNLHAAAEGPALSHAVRLTKRMHRAGSSLVLAPMDLGAYLTTEMRNRYPNMPPENNWRDLLDHALTEPEDPCDADILSTFGANGGWGSGFNSLANEVAVAAYFNKTVAICNRLGKIWWTKSMWNVLTGPLRVCERSELCQGRPQYTADEEMKKIGRMPWGLSAIFWGGCLDPNECDMDGRTYMPKLPPAQRFPGISPTFRSFQDRFRHLVYEQIYQFDETTQSAVTAYRKWVMPDRFSPYVGVHIRGSDKFREAVDVGMKPYVQQTVQLVRKTGAHSVYLASDDYNRSQEFKELFLKSLLHFPLNMKPAAHYPQVKGGWDIQGGPRIVFMAEIEILRDAVGFVGTASSNVGRLVYFLRKGRLHPGSDLLDISVDEGNDFLSRHC